MSTVAGLALNAVAALIRVRAGRVLGCDVQLVGGSRFIVTSQVERSSSGAMVAALGDLELLIRRARGALAAVEVPATDGRPSDAVAYLDRAGEQVTAAARRFLSRYRRLDGRLTLLGTVVQEWPVALVVGFAAYVSRLLLDLSAVVTVTIAVVVLFGASAVWVSLLRRRERVNESRRFAELWPGGSTGPDGTELGGPTYGLSLIVQARRDIGGIASTRLAASARFGLTGSGVVAASDHDAILWHLRRADLKLCQSYEAATRQTNGGPA